MTLTKINSYKKILCLIIGSIILCSSYLGYLIYTSTAEISSAKTNGLATVIFIIAYFGLFAITKHVEKGILRINKKLLLNFSILISPFVITGILYLFIKSLLILLFSFIFFQIMITIYYNNFVPVPGYPRAYKLFRENQYEKAIISLSNILKHYPKSFETLILIANAHTRLLEYDKAIDYLLKAKEIDQENVIVYINLANAYTATGNFELAIETSEKIVALSPENWNALYTIALCNMFEKNYTKAINFYTKTLEKDIPEVQKFLVHYGMYLCHISLNNKKEAEIELTNFKSHSSKEVTGFWKKQLLIIKDNENKPSLFVKEAITASI